MNVWETLGIEPTSDSAKIKAAFSLQSKKCHPEEHPEEFQKLFSAYKQALKMAKWLPKSEVLDENTIDAEANGEVKKEDADREKSPIVFKSSSESGYESKEDSGKSSLLFEERPSASSADENKERQLAFTLLKNDEKPASENSEKEDTPPVMLESSFLNFLNDEKSEAKVSVVAKAEDASEPKVSFEKMENDEGIKEREKELKRQQIKRTFSTILDHKITDEKLKAYFSSPDFLSLRMDEKLAEYLLPILKRGVYTKKISINTRQDFLIPYVKEWSYEFQGTEIYPQFLSAIEYMMSPPAQPARFPIGTILLIFILAILVIPKSSTLKASNSATPYTASGWTVSDRDRLRSFMQEDLNSKNASLFALASNAKNHTVSRTSSSEEVNTSSLSPEEELSEMEEDNSVDQQE